MGCNLAWWKAWTCGMWRLHKFCQIHQNTQGGSSTNLCQCSCQQEPPSFHGRWCLLSFSKNDTSLALRKWHTETLVAKSVTRYEPNWTYLAHPWLGYLKANTKGCQQRSSPSIYPGGVGENSSNQGSWTCEFDANKSQAPCTSSRETNKVLKCYFCKINFL